MEKLESKNTTKEAVEDEYAELDQSKKRKCMHSEGRLEMTKVNDGSAQRCTCQKLTAAESKNDTSDLITDGSSFLAKLEGIQKNIFRFIVCANLPFSAVELPSFIHLLQELGLDYDFESLSRHSVKRIMVAEYANERDFVLHDLGETPGMISLTLDYWRLEYTDDEYMCITAHWIDKEWKMQKRIIYFKGIPLPFSGSSLADEVATCLSEWNIDDKICTITLDNCHNNDVNNVMATCLKSRSSTHKNLLCGGLFYEVRCFCDIFNWIVQVALEKVDNIVSKIRNGVKYIKDSASRREKFYDMAEKIFHLDTSRKLKTDICLRWNSTFLMLEIAIYYQKVFQHWEQKDNSFGMFVLSDAEWKKIEAVKKILKPFYGATCSFSDIKSPTSAVYFGELCNIHRCLLNASKNTPEFLSDMITEMVKRFQNYWDEHYLLLSCAVVLDPRMKLAVLEFFFSEIYDNVEERINTVVHTLEALFNHYKEMSSKVTSISTTEVSGDCGSRFSMRHCLGEHYEKYLAFVRKSRGEKSELQRYLDESRFPFDPEDSNSEFDILGYWSTIAKWSYPTLQLMARDILAIPVSAVASESVPCIGKKVINPRMSSVSEKTMQSLVCLEDWYRAKGLTSGGSGILGLELPLDNVESSDDEDDNINAG